MAMFDLFKDEKKLVTFALILIIILGIITYNLYYSSNMDPNGNEYGCFDTIRNIFDALPIIGGSRTCRRCVETVTEKVDEVIQDIPKLQEEKKFLISIIMILLLNKQD